MKAITTTYHGPTNLRGSRIVAHDSDGNRVTMPINHAIDITPNHAAAARKLAEKMAWTGELIGGHTKTGMVWVWANYPYPGTKITIR